MQKLLCVLFALALNLSASAQDVKAPRIKFLTDEFDFGQFSASAGTKQCSFVFVNKGTGKLVITNVHAYCECIKTSYPKDFIAPGDSGKIVVSYTSNQLGEFMKDVQVYTNCEPSLYRLKLTGEIVEEKVPVSTKKTQSKKKSKRRKR